MLDKNRAKALLIVSLSSLLLVGLSRVGLALVCRETTDERLGNRHTHESTENATGQTWNDDHLMESLQRVAHHFFRRDP